MVEKLLTERQKTHGSFKDHAIVAQLLKNTCENSEGYGRLQFVHKEALEMVLHKVARILSGDPNFNDHWDDIAGYATLVSKHITEERLQNEQLQKAD